MGVITNTENGLLNYSGDLIIKNEVSDGDVYIGGVDGSSTIYPVKFDVSTGGTATFSGSINPAVDASLTLGTGSLRWNFLYVNNAISVTDGNINSNAEFDFNQGANFAGPVYLQGGSYTSGSDTVSTAATVIPEGQYIYAEDSSTYLRKLIGKSSDRLILAQAGTSLYQGVDFFSGNSNNSILFRFYQSSNVICTINSTALTASGDVVAYSDKRLKTDIKTLDGKKVYEMRGVSFVKDDKNGSGVIAQELEKIAPELVNNDSEYKAVAYGNLAGYLIEAIKELKAEIEELKSNKCNCNK